MTRKNHVWKASLFFSKKIFRWCLTFEAVYILTSCNFVISRFGFESGIWVLIAPVPGNCILFTLNKSNRIYVVAKTMSSLVVFDTPFLHRRYAPVFAIPIFKILKRKYTKKNN